VRIVNNITRMTFDLFAIDSKPYEISFSDWTMNWWRWLLLIPKENSPAYDWIGGKALVNQTNRDVVYFCQTIDGSQERPVRSVNKVLNKAILMPIINWISVQYEDGDTDQEMKDRAKQKIDLVRDMCLRINGEEIEGDLFKFRIQSPFFELSLEENNVLDVKPGIRRFFSDGYWLFLKPSPFIQRIDSYATCSSGATKITASYSFVY
jgi:hypothetical protein